MVLMRSLDTCIKLLPVLHMQKKMYFTVYMQYIYLSNVHSKITALQVFMKLSGVKPILRYHFYIKNLAFTIYMSDYVCFLNLLNEFGEKSLKVRFAEQF